MMLTEQKDKILNDIYSKVYNTVSSSLYIDLNGPSSNLQSTLTHAITEGIKVGLSELIDKTYTNYDFEKDVGLR